MEVTETRLRSILKVLVQRVFEIIVDVFVMAAVFCVVAQWDVGWRFVIAAFIVESFCMMFGYINERLWNFIQWGRKIRRKKRKTQK
jgi:hypothetical protein